MPISGLVIRTLNTTARARSALLTELRQVDGLALGETAAHGISAVLEAPSYAEHDASLNQLGELTGVSAIDIVFHDFSDVTQFGAMPRRRAETGR